MLDELVDADVADVEVAIAEVVVVVHRGLELRELAVRVRGLEVGVAALARRGRFGEAPHLMPAVSVPLDDKCGVLGSKEIHGTWEDARTRGGRQPRLRRCDAGTYGRCRLRPRLLDRDC